MKRGLEAESPKVSRRRLMTVLVEVHKRVGRPQLSADFLAGDQFAGPLQQHDEDPKRLFRHTQAHARFAQFAGKWVGFVSGEAIDQPGGRGVHG